MNDEKRSIETVQDGAGPSMRSFVMTVAWDRLFEFYRPPRILNSKRRSHAAFIAKLRVDTKE